MPKVKVGDIKMYYEVHGRGEALVLIQGYDLNSTFWFRQVPAFAKEYRVITVDNRGSGRSDKPDTPYTTEIMAADIAGLLNAIGIDKAHIFGISMGGLIAQNFAINYSEKVGALILGCTCCGGRQQILANEETLSSFFKIFEPEHMRHLTLKEHFREWSPFAYTQKFINDNLELVEQGVTIMAQYPSPPHSYARQLQAIAAFDTYDRLPQIKAPTLVITGVADRIVPAENTRLLASRIPNAASVILKNAGHFFFIEAEKETNRAVLDFLRRHPSTSSG